MKTLRLTRFAPVIRGALPFTPLDLEVAPGETLALLGPSGAGKSSVLRAVAGLIPASGRVSIGEREVSALPPEQRGAVYLHQTPRLFPHLTVAENIAFPMRLRGVASAVAHDMTGQLLARIQLPTAGSRNVTSLSGGEQQRVALARALAATPDVLLLDEPFAALDPALRAEVREALVSLLEPSPPTTVLVTHDPDEAAALASRIAIMLDGAVVQVASPRALFDGPGTLAVAAFLGIDNLWTRADAMALGAELIVPGAGVEHIGVPSAALLATGSPDSDHQVVRVRETRNGQRVEGMTHGVAWVATASGGLKVGDTVALMVEASRVLCYDAAGTLMAA